MSSRQFPFPEQSHSTNIDQNEKDDIISSKYWTNWPQKMRMIDPDCFLHYDLSLELYFP